jgi:hypothetical protein
MKIFFISFFLLSSIYCQSQSIQGYNPMSIVHSPNSTDLGKYGDVPANLYNGSIDVNVPIHTVEERGVKLEVKLQYNSGGVRVQDVPGWVGQNWMLNAGGVITRTVRGTTYDEYNLYHGHESSFPNNELGRYYKYILEWECHADYQKNTHIKGYYYQTKKLNHSDWNTHSNLKALAERSYLYFKPFSEGYSGLQYFVDGNWRMDLEPDLFTFNFMGHTGHFFLGQDGEWKVRSSSNLKIECDLYNDVDYPCPLVPDDYNNFGAPFRFPKTLNKIKIIDENGNTFIFQDRELTLNSFFQQHPGLNSNARFITSAIYLSKVYDKNDNLLYSFEYEKGPWQGKFYIDYSAVNQCVIDYEGSCQPSSGNSSSSTNQPFWGKYGFGADGQLILPLYLKKINTESGVEFEFNSQLVQNAMKYQRNTGGSLFVDFNEENYDTYYNMFYKYKDRTFYFLKKESDMITDKPVSDISNIYDLIFNKKLTNIKIKDNSLNLINIDLNFIDQAGVRLFLHDVVFNENKKYSFDYIDYWMPSFFAGSDQSGYYNNKQFKFTYFHQLDYWNNELLALKETDPNYVKSGSLSKITYPTGGYTEFEFEAHDYSKYVNNLNVLTTGFGLVGGLRIKKIKNFDSNNVNLSTKEYIYKKNLNSNESSGIWLTKPLYYLNFGTINYQIENSFISERPYYSYYAQSIGNLTSLSGFMGVNLEYTDVFEKSINNGYTHYKYSNYENYPDTFGTSLVAQSAYFSPKNDNSVKRGKLLEKNIFNNSNVLLKRNKYFYYSNDDLKVNAVYNNFIFRQLAQGFLAYEYVPSFATTYQVSYSDSYIVKEIEENYLNGNVLSDTKEFLYKRFPEIAGTIKNNGNLFLYKNLVLKSDGKSIIKTYKYPFDFNDVYNTIFTMKNFFPVINEKIEECATGDIYETDCGNPIQVNKINYSLLNSGNNVYKVSVLNTESNKGNNSFEEKFKIESIDSKGNITCFTKNNGVKTSVIWGYNQTKPILEIENLNYTSLPVNIINNLQSLSNADTDNCTQSTCTEELLRAEIINIIKLYPNSKIKGYTYDILSGVTSVISENQDVTYYQYDDLMRLKRIVDKQKNILKEYEYHFKPSFNPQD